MDDLRDGLTALLATPGHITRTKLRALLEATAPPVPPDGPPPGPDYFADTYFPPPYFD